MDDTAPLSSFDRLGDGGASPLAAVAALSFRQSSSVRCPSVSTAGADEEDEEDMIILTMTLYIDFEAVSDTLSRCDVKRFYISDLN